VEDRATTWSMSPVPLPIAGAGRRPAIRLPALVVRKTD